ncbi:granulin b [Chanos chanos]|uniref:Granulin b n=1 Tax=Chanos chanos TaxID=29144 RepID=A0A6J2V4I7_CHACN|nr:progranulin [Chanos chanos]
MFYNPKRYFHTMMRVCVLVCVLGVCSALICPDGGMCEDGDTCCETPSGKYGCCPLPNAECCSDHLHCCYENTLCDLEHSKCINKTISLPLVRRTPAKQATEQVKAVVCPDGESECPDDTTCCEMPDGNWGCCPMVKAVCCDDKRHCCPQGTTCDLIHSKCVSPSYGSTPLWRKFSARRRASWEKRTNGERESSPYIVCPDQATMCPDGTTCCALSNGSYGCCPMPKAVCCSDHMHCCPEGTTCDLSHSTCVGANGNAAWATKIPGLTYPKVKVEDVPCDDTKACPDDTTCCMTAEGDWACCPLPKAVCCEDHIHCCPSGTTCDLAAGTCDSPFNLVAPVPWLEKVPALSRTHKVKVEDVPCDDTKACPDDTTCCMTAEGDWACCPLPKAVCCEDHIHCCPSGTTCDLAAGTCDSPFNLVAPVPWLEKVPALARTHKVKVEDVPCDDTKACPDDTTCCMTAEGDWACCPLPKAVCCEDHIHCCPSGTTCDLAAGTCDSPFNLVAPVPWLEKVPALSRTHKVKVEDVPCDDTKACPDDTTCCKTAEGDWACCPLPKAVCCEDHIHCCPSGTTCDLAAGTCDSPFNLVAPVPWLEKVPALSRTHKVKVENVPCDDTKACPDDTTCCKTAEGDWACCPLPKAVCCEDHIHCCPHGSVCNLAAQTCDSALSSVPMLRKIPTVPSPSFTAHANNIANDDSPLLTQHGHMCDDRTSCPRDNTCCYMDKQKAWGCCPLPKAVCCSDGEHCCPSGYKCNEGRTSCHKAGQEISWYTKHKARVSLEVTAEEKQGSEVTLGIGDVRCDPMSTCASGSTCCKLPTGEWACCPLVKAVCCEDHEHCCPQGYTCNLQSGTCVKPSPTHTLPRTRLSAADTSDALTHTGADVTCDALTRCSSSQTCCQTSDSTWACCPYQQAVCCADMRHCCPRGYICNPEVKGCTRAPGLTWWDDFLLEKLAH